MHFGAAGGRDLLTPREAFEEAGPLMRLAWGRWSIDARRAQAGSADAVERRFRPKLHLAVEAVGREREVLGKDRAGRQAIVDRPRRKEDDAKTLRLFPKAKRAVEVRPEEALRIAPLASPVSARNVREGGMDQSIAAVQRGRLAEEP